jgi:hypothetical protein
VNHVHPSVSRPWWRTAVNIFAKAPVSPPVQKPYQMERNAATRVKTPSARHHCIAEPRVGSDKDMAWTARPRTHRRQHNAEHWKSTGKREHKQYFR